MTTKLNKRVLLVLVLLFVSSGPVCFAQRGVPPSRVAGFTLFGDVEVIETEKREGKAVLFDLLLYTRSGVLIDRQKVGSKGRYRFLNVPAGDYDLVFEFENVEVARTQIRLVGIPTDFRQDVAMQWRAGAVAGKSSKPEVISADELYDRKPPNRERFENAREAFDKKDYERAIAILRQIVTDDRKDFPAWSELGTCHLVRNDLNEAEVAYLSATEVRPTFFRALMNLGKVRIMLKNFEGAIEPLTEAVKIQPTSADANYYLGEAYLQLKKGSKAVGYLEEAAKLGRADAHLRLATLYNAVGMKDKAALEYEAFLKKRPDYAERKKLEEYIAANKKK